MPRTRRPSTAETGQRNGQTLQACQRGAVYVEYLVVVAIVGLSLAATLVSIGPGVVQSWSFSRQVLYGRAP